MMAFEPRLEPRLDSAGAPGRGGARPDSTGVWLLRQTACFLSAGFVLASAGQARPGRHVCWLAVPDGWLVTAHQAYLKVWEVAVRYGATAAAPKPAGSKARRQKRRVGGVVWLGDLAVALATAQRAALLGFSGPQVREERKWLSLAKWAARQSGAGRHGCVGAQPPRDRDQVEGACPRRRWWLIKGEE